MKPEHIIIAALAISTTTFARMWWVEWRGHRALRGFRHATVNAQRTGIPSDGRR